MSATGRNKKGKERREADFYPTPAWCTRAILPHLGLHPCHEGRLLSMLDPACGDGAILDVLREEFGVKAWGFDIDRTRVAIAASKCHQHAAPQRVWQADALEESWPDHVDLVITNPPYSLASEFVSRFISQFTVKDTGELRVDGAFLLPLSFLGSDGRASFHRGFPSDLYVMPHRPSFTGDGDTDSEVYCWAVWGPNRGGRWQVIECDP